MKNWARSGDFSRVFKRTTEVVTTKFSSTEYSYPEKFFPETFRVCETLKVLAWKEFILTTMDHETLRRLAKSSANPLDLASQRSKS
jgi:hypothetical protein